MPRRRTDIDWSKQRLGEESDRSIAKRLKCAEQTVAKERNRLGIPAFAWKVDWDRQPLGAVPDGWLASELGVSRAAVEQARRVRGIKPFYARQRQSGED